jgi:hypothetical protein
MGLNRPSEWEKHPRLRALYEDYLLCRNQDLKIFEKDDGSGTKKNPKKKLVSVPWTTGFNILLTAGGVEEQSYFKMRMFGEFLRGERQGQIRLMNS